MKELNEVEKAFANNLNLLMKEKNLNKAELARATNIPRTTISCWLNWQRSPQMHYLCILADYFGCTVDFLLGREI